MKKLELITALLVATTALSLLNTYMVFGVSQQIGYITGGVALAATGSGGTLKEAAPLQGGSQPQPEPSANISADDDAMLGSPDALVTIMEFSDYECPFCASFMPRHCLQ